MYNQVDLLNKYSTVKLLERMMQSIMGEGYHIESMDEPEWAIIGGGIRDYNNQQAGDGHGKNLCFVLRGPDQSIGGGVIAETHWNWLFVNLMWIKEELRGHGYGHQLLDLVLSSY